MSTSIKDATVPFTFVHGRSALNCANSKQDRLTGVLNSRATVLN